jgi:hypothetical protein
VLVCFSCSYVNLVSVEVDVVDDADEADDAVNDVSDFDRYSPSTDVESFDVPVIVISRQQKRPEIKVSNSFSNFILNGKFN